MDVIVARVLADPRTVELIEFGKRWWWVGLLVLACFVLLPRARP